MDDFFDSILGSKDVERDLNSFFHVKKRPSPPRNPGFKSRVPFTFRFEALSQLLPT